MPKLPIYMDYHATTPVDPRVLEEMLPYFSERFGNAASRNHSFGWQAEEAVEQGRKQVAALIGASAKEIVFTSGATESDNLALKGVAQMYRQKGDHVVTVVTEHKAILDTAKRLEKEGMRVTFLGVGRDGLVNLDELRAAITDKTILVSVMAANNEIGVVQPIAEIGRITRERGVLLHSDAVQAVGKIPFDVEQMQVDLASLSAHKIYGPKGVGALYVRRKNPRVLVAPIIDGGGHERGMRSGTLNVPGIVGFGKAAELCRQEMATEAPRLKALRDRLLEGLRRETRRGDGERVDGGPAAQQPERELRLRRGRVAADGHRRRRRVVGLRVHVGEPRAFLRAEGARDLRRAGPFVDSIRPRAVDDRGRGGLRRWQAGFRGAAPARDVAALRDGQGENGPPHRPSGARGIPVRERW